MLYRPTSLLEWLYVLCVCAQVAVSLGLESQVFVLFNTRVEATHFSSNPKAVVPAFLSILLMGWLYLLFLLYDTLATRNIFQAISLPIYSTIILIFLGLQLDQLKEAVLVLLVEELIDFSAWDYIKPLLFANIGVTAALVCIQIGLTFPLARVFGGVILKHLDADVKLKQDFRWVQIFVALNKVNFFLMPATVVGLAVLLLGRWDFDKWLEIASLPVIYTALFVAPHVVRHETKFGSWTIMAATLLYLSILVFTMTRMFQPNHEAPFLPARKAMTALGCISVLACFLMIASIYKCTLAFGKGLKPYLTVTARAYDVQRDYEMTRLDEAERHYN